MNNRLMDLIPENKDKCAISRDERLDIIAKVFLRGDCVCTRLNDYGGGKIVRKTSKKDGSISWYETKSLSVDCDDRYTVETLFLPSEDEVSEVMAAFKAKGWHGFYDTEMCYYRISQHQLSRGDYANRFTRWIF